MLPRMGRNAAFDQVERAVKGILKNLAMGLFAKLFLYHRRRSGSGPSTIRMADRHGGRDPCFRICG